MNPTDFSEYFLALVRLYCIVYVDFTPVVRFVFGWQDIADLLKQSVVVEPTTVFVCP